MPEPTPGRQPHQNTFRRRCIEGLRYFPSSDRPGFKPNRSAANPFGWAANQPEKTPSADNQANKPKLLTRPIAKLPGNKKKSRTGGS